MLHFLAPRLLRTLLVIVGVVTVTFFLTRTFSDPVNLILPVSATDEQRATLRHQLELDRPVIDQYVNYVGDAVHGDFGESVWQRRPALEPVLDALPASIYLASVSIALVILVAMPLGVIAGMRPGSWPDRAVSAVSTVGISAPDFWVGLILIVIFAVTLGWLPTSGYGGPQYVLLPAIALALPLGGRLVNVVREAVAAEMSKRYVLAARAKGMTMPRVMTRHVLKNVIPVSLTMVGYDFAFIFTGNALGVETVFGWPGMGRLAVQATLQEDVILVSAVVIVTGLIIALVNMAIDIVVAAVDRRTFTS
jgi:peptide/nickel transport system permease protein